MIAAFAVAVAASAIVRASSFLTVLACAGLIGAYLGYELAVRPVLLVL